MTDAESLKKEIDTSGNEKLEVQEMEEFLKSEENIKRLWETMNSGTSPELKQEMENALNNLCENFLLQPELSDNQQNIINYFLNNFWDKYPELKEKIENKAKWNQESIEDQYTDIISIQQEIDNEIDIMLQNMPLNNLKELWIDISLQNNKKSIWIKRENVIKNIKKPEDINKINDNNINQYFTIPSNISQENYTAITENIKQILYRHLQLHPGRKTIIGNEWYSSWMSLKTTRENDKYETNLHQQIQKLQKKSLDEQINSLVKNLPNNCDLLDLWLKTTLNQKNEKWKNKYKQDDVLKTFFDKIPVEQSSKFFWACEKNPFINELKNNYALYWLNKNNCINTDGKTYSFLNWQNKSKFDNFRWKWINLSEEVSFDELYEKTKNFYESLKVYNISPKIPIPAILEFYDKVRNLQPRLEQIKKQYKKSMEEVSQMRNNPLMNIWSPTIWWWYGSWANLAEQSAKRTFDRDKARTMTDIAEAYAKLLLNDPAMRWKKITAPKEFWWFTLDFSKTTPEAVVRDSFSENLEDQWNLFLYNLKNDRQAAFWSFLWMVWWIAWAWIVTISTWNIRATSAWFTAWLRLWNWIWQELWNSWEFLYEQTTWNIINDWNNKVEDFWQWFLRWVWVLDQNYEYVWTTKFLSWLWFDYLSTVATFWLSQKFWWFLWKLEWIKFAWWALKFGMEELILENFFVDIPMNIVQSWVEAVTWINNWWVTVWTTSMWNERTEKWEKVYEKWSLSDMLRAMKDATEKNLSFENLSQTFFNTVIYWWFLEWWWAAIKKMKWYLPAGQVSNFTERSAAASAAFLWLTNFMSSKNINFNKDWVCIDTKTKLKIEESDPRFQELCTHLNAVEATKTWVIESFETIMETQKQMVSDPENRTWLLFRLWLISPTNTPLNILKKKKELVEKKLKEAKAKWDNNKVNQLQKLLDIYTDAETKLDNSNYFDWKSKKLFEWDGTQARWNSEMMDNLLNEVNKEWITETEITEKLGELRKEISEQYKESTWKELNLTDEQLLSVLDAHEQDWKLWELTLWQLKQKVKILDETITDPKVRRFLLEAGFCGKIMKNTNSNERLQDFIQINTQKEYTWSEDFQIINSLIDDKLHEDPDNIYLQRRQNEIYLATHYSDAFEVEWLWKISCIDINRWIYKLSTQKWDLFWSIYSIIDANDTLLEYKPIADAIAFNENNLMWIKPDVWIKFSSTMVNSWSFAQANVHKYPADIDLAEHIKLTIEWDSNPQEALSKLLVTHIQNHIKTILNWWKDNLSFIEAKIWWSKTQKRSNWEPKSLKWSAEEILAWVHKWEWITLEEACKDPWFFKFDYTFIDSDWIPKECTKVTSITIEQNGKVIQSNIGQWVWFQEVYFSSPGWHTVVDDIYKTENIDYYHNDFLKKDISHYWEEWNALKVCKRLYNFVKTDWWRTDTWKSCMEKLSNLFENPILSWVSLIDWLEIWTKWWHDTQNVINLLKEYGKNYLSIEENLILKNNLKKIEQGQSIDNSIKEIKNIITKNVESTVLSYLDLPENNIIKTYLNPIIENVEYNSGNNK